MRLIDADALEKEIRIYAKTLYQNVKYSLTKDFRPSRDFVRGVEDGYCRIISALKSQPTIDAVKVVRCKDCRHFDRESWDEPMNLLPSYCLKKLPGIGYVMYGNGPESYCSYGERRTDE